MKKILESPLLYGILAAGTAFIPKLTISSQVTACILCACLYTLTNKKIMPTHEIFTFAVVFCIFLTLGCGGLILYLVIKGLIPAFWKPFLQVFCVSVLSFFTSIFIFFATSLIVNGFLVLFQRRR